MLAAAHATAGDISGDIPSNPLSHSFGADMCLWLSAAHLHMAWYALERIWTLPYLHHYASCLLCNLRLAAQWLVELVKEGGWNASWRDGLLAFVVVMSAIIGVLVFAVLLYGCVLPPPLLLLLLLLLLLSAVGSCCLAAHAMLLFGRCWLAPRVATHRTAVSQGPCTGTWGFESDARTHRMQVLYA